MKILNCINTSLTTTLHIKTLPKKQSEQSIYCEPYLDALCGLLASKHQFTPDPERSRERGILLAERKKLLDLQAEYILEKYNE